MFVLIVAGSLWSGSLCSFFFPLITILSFMIISSDNLTGYKPEKYMGMLWCRNFYHQLRACSQSCIPAYLPLASISFPAFILLSFLQAVRAISSLAVTILGNTYGALPFPDELPVFIPGSEGYNLHLYLLSLSPVEF
jgi:hypothetical protein